MNLLVNFVGEEYDKEENLHISIGMVFVITDTQCLSRKMKECES